MKRLLLWCFAVCVLAGSAVAQSESALGVGARRHVTNDNFEKLPYQDGDLGYLVAYEYHNQMAFWQLATEYAPNLKSNQVDYVVTPQLNLFVKDGGFRAGIGILGSYNHNDDPEWTRPYYQFALGYEIPFGPHLGLGANAWYAFEEWSKLNKFKFSDLDYSAQLTYHF